MKKSIFFIFLFLILFVTCKENEPTAPEEETPQQEILAEANIGPEGGTLETEDFKLTVPSGALSSSFDFKLYEEIENEFGDNAASPLYKVEGIPDDFNKPLQISLKYTGTLSGETAIAYGHYVQDELIDSLVQVYDFINATDSSGILKCELPVASNKSISKQNSIFDSPDILRTFMAVKNGLRQTTQYFNYIKFASNLTIDQLDVLDDFLNQLATKYNNMGFKPVKFDVKIINQEKGKLFRASFPNSVLFYAIPTGIDINKYQFFIEMVYALGRAKVYQNTNGTWIINTFPHWVGLAYYDWGEEWEEFQSSSFFKYKFADFVIDMMNNLIPQSKLKGFSAVLFLEYLVDKYGNGIWSKIYQNIEDGKSQLDAVFESTNPPNNPIDWLWDFHKYLIENYKFSGLLGDFWITENEQEFTISNTNKEESVTKSFNDLSGKWYRIRLQDDIPENSDLSIKAYYNLEHPALFSVYKFQGLTLELVDDADNYGVYIENVNTLADNYYGLIVLVTNPLGSSPDYNSSDNITTEFKLISNIEKEYKFASIDLHVKGFYLRDGEEDPYFKFYNTLNVSNQVGGLNGTTFSSSWSETEEDDYPSEGTVITRQGSINIVISEDFSEIISYTETFSETWPGFRNSSSSLSVKNIPFYESDSWSGDDTYLLVIGNETCDYVVSRSDNTTWWDGKSFVFSRNECDQESYIMIKLYK